jgi:hypothetical protein
VTKRRFSPQNPYKQTDSLSASRSFGIIKTAVFNRRWPVELTTLDPGDSSSEQYISKPAASARRPKIAMFKRAFLLAVLCVANVAICRAANLDALLFPLTGEIQLRNSSGLAVPFVSYSITSPFGALDSNSGVWKSISDNYDVSGNGFIDPSFNWTKISATSSELTEGAFSGPGGSLAAFRSVSLGQIWNPALYPSNDLTFTILQADTTPVVVTKHYAVAGDYNSDGTVNSADYAVWRSNFGSTISLGADGNLNGVVDAADYTVWRNNLGLLLPAGAGSSLSGGASLSAAGVVVPEPAGLLLIIMSGAFAALNVRVRARRAGRCESSR